MPRELRPRKPRKSYADIAGNGIEDNESAAGPSNILLEDEADDSENEFEPDKDPKGSNKVLSSDEDEDDVDMDDIQEPESEMEVEETPNQRRKTASSSKPPRAPITSATYPGSPTMSVSLKTRKEKSRRLPPRVHQATCTPSEATPLVAAPRVAKTYALPSPSAHHRHRAIPVFFREEMVERLDELPALFNEPRIVPTNSMTADHSLTNRVSKAWGFNVGAGPVWQIMEDRSCYKESISSGPGPEKESLRRPRVYQDVSVRPDWQVLITRDALKYLPTDSTMTEDGQFKPPPQVDCYLGPCDRQTRVSFNMFDSVATSAYFEDGTGYVFNAGSPVWGIDWCPTYQADRPVRQFRHHLAVAPFPSRSHAPSIGVKTARPSPACVQIWALKPRTREDNTMDDDHPQRDPAEVRCEMVLCLESGPAQEIKWCPLPAHDPWEGAPPRIPRRLGILAGTFEDGSLSIYVVPDPEDVRPPEHDAARPVFVGLPEPALRIEHEGASCWSLDWANSEVIAVGLTNGCLAVYNVKQALESGETSNIFPTHFIAVHQSAIRALAWIRVPPTDGSGVPNLSEDPMVIASGGYDGVECLTDIREPHGNVVNRTRDVINSATYSVFATGPIMIDHDNTVKSYSVSPSMLGRGHILMEPDGPVWSVSASDYHPQLAVGSADGSCTTTNTLKSTRRGGIVPFLVHKIYQLDYSRKTGEFRMLEHFLPQEMQEKTTSAKGKAQGKDKHKDKQDADADAETKGRSTNTGVWPSEIGVHRVAWNNGNGLGGAPLLASATASGLCRVDWLLGRWIKDRTPYVSVPKMRKEVEGASDESDEEV
ncbi:hypothetical protein JVT61DRAFT_13581 [Boletus reticuloceps]|uniref:Transcription factor tau subunit sfc6 n=1 Tax=Boletus reticuloceps TaxID=495285 RepID=A0A8I2YDC4_9AGAM|nr:hypothetical protein JVT61DRAFT_13581 [Boletus reticuloceps]